MKNIYHVTENTFGKLSQIIIRIIGNSITFILAICLVIFWVTENAFRQQNLHESISDLLFGFTFLSFFIIQKSYTRISTALNIKLNELVIAQDKARNELVNAEEKTEQDLKKIVMEHKQMMEQNTDAPE